MPDLDMADLDMAELGYGGFISTRPSALLQRHVGRF
jgi:hypothetical protein